MYFHNQNIDVLESYFIFPLLSFYRVNWMEMVPKERVIERDYYISWYTLVRKLFYRDLCKGHVLVYEP